MLVKWDKTNVVKCVPKSYGCPRPGICRKLLLQSMVSIKMLMQMRTLSIHTLQIKTYNKTNNKKKNQRDTRILVNF